MKIAIATLATNHYAIGAEILHYSIQKNLPAHGNVDFIKIDDGCIFDSYSNIDSNTEVFGDAIKKLFAFTLAYDRIIVLDADMLCINDVSLLLSEELNDKPFYCVKDPGCMVYYPKQIEEIGLIGNQVFNAGLMVYNRNQIKDFHKMLIKGILSGKYKSYDKGDQGYLNHFMQKNKVPVGFLPDGYNFCLDDNMAKIPDKEKCFIHFTGKMAKPWLETIQEDDWRNEYHKEWEKYCTNYITITQNSRNAVMMQSYGCVNQSLNSTMF